MQSIRATGPRDRTISLGDTPSADAFGRLRVSDPETLFDSKQIFDNQPIFWDESLESGGGISSAHSTDTASTVITSTVDTAGLFTRQTFMRFNYQPGKSQQILMTGILDRSGGGTGTQRRIGSFDDNNGVFFEDDEGIIKVVRRTNVTGSAVDNKVTQASWNVDPMDGSGSSGVTVDWEKTQIFAIDFEWLGVGRVRMCLVIDGVFYLVHEFLNSNVLDKVYMSTPNLPLRYQVECQATSAASTMECICATIISEGGRQDLGVTRYASTAGTHVDAATENLIYAIIGIRLKSTHLGAVIKILSVAVSQHAANGIYEWILLFNPTVAGTFTYSAQTNSAIAVATGATANTITGGTEISGGQGTSTTKGGNETGDVESALRLWSTIGGTVDEIVLAGRPIGGSANLDFEGSITWKELQ